MAPRPITGLALCAGVGGLELGLRLALGDTYRTVGYVEREAYAAAALVARMEDAALDQAPVWDDLSTFDGRPWRGAVDLISAGFPCQPWSVAGKRKGTADDRWLWPDIARIIGEVEPSLVFLENVPGLLRHGLAVVLEDLTALGFDAEWDSFRASDIGAPHRRERVFVLAYRPERGRGVLWGAPWGEGLATRGDGGMAEPEHARQRGLRAAHDEAGRDASRDEPDRRDPALADAHVDAEGPRRRGQPRGRADATDGGVALPDPSLAGLPDAEPEDVPGPGREDEGRAAPEFRFPPFPPGPGDRDGWARVLADYPGLAPAVEPAVRRVADGPSCRVDELRTLGNAVVPVVAARAFLTLAERAGMTW